jgi:hypothetical protein
VRRAFETAGAAILHVAESARLRIVTGRASDHARWLGA